MSEETIKQMAKIRDIWIEIADTIGRNLWLYQACQRYAPRRWPRASRSNR